MRSFLEPYQYRLFLVNRTRFPLVPSTIRLNQGIWNRAATDGALPVAVPPGEEAEALAVRASSERNRGYEFRCCWTLDDGGGADAGSLTLFVSVPFAGGRNKAGLDVSGHIRATGWTGVLTIGHRFEHRLEVRFIP